MRPLLALIPLVALACGAAPKAGDGKSKELKLDVKAPWADNQGDYPTRPFGRAPGDALAGPDAPLIAIQGATVLTAAGQTFSPGTVITKGGRILYVGARKAAPRGAQVIDAKGRFVTPGIIDVHSHIGVYAAPHVTAHSDGNEMTAPTTAQARALYGYWPQDPAITRARAGGVTSALILPGSANLIGGLGQSVVMKPGRHAREVVFPGSPPAIKMACGENPKRVYGEKGGPATRMGEYAAFRAAFQQAAEYDAKLKKYRRDRQMWETKKKRAGQLEKKAAAKKGKGGKKVGGEPAPDPPPHDDKLETLAAVLRGEVMVQIHCYRAAEIREMVEIADEFGFKIRTFHHALGAYKVRDVLAEKDIAIATWSDWWGFKMEAFDGIPENAGLMTESGGRAIIHSDSSSDIQRLNQEAAKALGAARRAGIRLTDDQALRWITANPAWAMGIDGVVGTLEAGKRADVVIWSRHPFTVEAKADVVLQGGVVAYERTKGIAPTDFELGNWGMTPGPGRASSDKGLTR